ncbi:pyruvate, water dikinase [Desulfovibrio subterraneus]|uniref:PEP/pyruvate-binding domain-containing protein n=1 Tax=Desulfovibrio subterraneus TaxID=2718620 RepID=UPI0022B92703|nr:PEP/pyruvate-binding domain-containing protein [Desulfovibrio subterraneus]WBF66186.1 pyruvate, water dikinase [Desulfovibrio subterraneus]
MLRKLRDILAFWRPRQRVLPFGVLFKKFQSILERNNRILELMADMGDKLGGEYVFDRQYILDAAEQQADMVFKLISDLSILTQRKNVELFLAFERIRQAIQEELTGTHVTTGGSYVIPLKDVGHDLSELAGGKMSNMGDIRNRLGLSTPDGFVITSRAFFDFMQQNGLLAMAREGISAWDGQDDAALESLAATMQERIMNAPLPRNLTTQVLAALDALAKAHGTRTIRVALRSSAWGEDGDASFAGQYETCLNVPRDEVMESYRKVVASTYSCKAWRYRLFKGYREHEVAMAVGCQMMVESTVGGVLHTYAPHIAEGVMVANAVWGLCSPVVDGNAPTDTIVLDRTAPYTLRSLSVGDKRRQLRLAKGGGTEWCDTPEGLHDVPSLTVEQLEHLAQAAMSIERYYKRPQDIEWAYDAKGTLQILQSRPLRFWAAPLSTEPQLEDVTRNAEVVFSGKGLVAQRGVAVGKVFVVDHSTDLDTFPHGAVLVSRYTSPRYSRVMHKAQGIITDVGSPTGHMSTIAREFRVPTVVNTEVATTLLQTGDEITLDATENVVYRGSICALDRFTLTEEEVFEDSYEYRLLRRVIKHTSPLNLLDPHADNFKPSSCRTYHDITRYIHEKAVEHLILISERQGAQYLSAPKRLVTDFPLGLMLIDAGDGTSCAPESRTASTSQIESIPLQEFLKGTECSEVWCTDPVSVDLGSFMSSFTRTFSSSLASPEEVGRNLVVVLKNYMNINMRLGYHFNIIDAYISDVINDNYIYFRFLGGVTEFIRRSRRARFIATVLEHFDFRVEVHGDLVVGRLKKLSRDRMAIRMRMLGGLVGYTRQLDARMHTDEDIRTHAQAFITAMKHFLGA